MDFDNLQVVGGRGALFPSKYGSPSYLDMSDGLTQKEMRRVRVKLMRLELKKEKLLLGKNYHEGNLFLNEIQEWVDIEKNAQKTAKKKLGSGYRPKHIRKRND